MNKNLKNLTSAEKLISDITKTGIKHKQVINLLKHGSIPKSILKYLYIHRTYYFNLNQVSKDYINSIIPNKRLKFTKDRNGINLKQIEELVHSHLAVIPDNWLQRYKNSKNKFLKFTVTKSYLKICQKILLVTRSKPKHNNLHTNRAKKKRHITNKSKSKALKSTENKNDSSLDNLNKAMKYAFSINTDKKIKCPPYKLRVNKKRNMLRCLTILGNITDHDVISLNLTRCQWCLFSRSIFFGRPWSDPVYCTSDEYEINFNYLLKLTLCHLITVSRMKLRSDGIPSNHIYVISIKLTKLGNKILQDYKKKVFTTKKFSKYVNHIKHNKQLKLYFFPYY